VSSAQFTQKQTPQGVCLFNEVYMLAIIGDLHGQFYMLDQMLPDIREKNVSAIIQVGDFGYYPNTIKNLEKHTFDIPFYWIDGNHEHFELFIHHTEVTEVHPNCFYVPRGTVMNLDKFKIGFMGGAGSIDKNLRIHRGLDWSELENITDEQFARMDNVDEVDILITHTPPQSVIDNNFDNSPYVLKQFGAAADWFDPNAHRIDALWARLNYPDLYCGHMHRSVIDRSCRILNINEVVYIDEVYQ